MSDAPVDAATLLPPKDGDAPLFELGRDELSVFFYLAFTDEELTAIFRELKLSVPGYRLEKLSGVQKADTLADEIRARPDARAPALELLRKIYEFPALDNVSLSAPVAEEIGLLAVEEDATVRTLWRLLADPQPEVRRTATPILQSLAKTYYGTGPAPKGPAPVDSAARFVPPPPAEPHDESAELKAAKKEAREAVQAAEKAQAKAESLAQQLKDVRAELAEASRELNQLKKVATKADTQLEKTKEQLEKARGKVTRQELERTKKDLEKATEAVAALTAREERWAAEKQALQQALEALKRASDHAPQAPAAPTSDEAPVEELPSTWLKPHFTQEFYDSLDGWDARLQRAAFKQAYLLSENHRHPSLRAIPLEGLPGYFRVRVATDVRLIYRRSEGTDVEILSLIDREDLDRYVRQAKTR